MQENRYKLIALLPMKLNSERVKGKNFKNFCSKPLFKWMLDTLISIEEVDKIVINTDAIHLLEEFGLDKEEKVLLRDRPEEIRGDHVSMNKIIADDIYNVNSDHYLMTHTTNPLISKQVIESCIKQYQKALTEGYDSLFSVNKFHSRFYTKFTKPINHDPNNLVRTQDLDPIYEENSCLYMFNKNSFEASNARIGEVPAFFVTPTLESVDIDDQDTWDLAKTIQIANLRNNEI